MRPVSFDYHRPESLAHALSLLAELGEDARPIAAGQSLLPMMNLRLARPSHLIDISRLDLGGIAMEGSFMRFGALVRHAQHLSDPLVASNLPVLRAGVAYIGHPVIRRNGTLGGSLAHADPTAELPLLCMLHDARIIATSAAGERRIRAEDFFLGAYTTSLDPEELLVGVEFPLPPGRCAGAFLEQSERHGDFAIAACGVMLSHSGGRVTRIAVCCSGASDVPLRARDLERALIGRAVSDIGAEPEITDFVAGLDPPDNHVAPAAYRQELIGVLIARALAQACDQALGEP